MARKRLTEMFPFLLPLRRWQKKQCCYLKMKFDKNVYADKISESLFPNMVFETSALMVNENSGFDIQFQYNKVHNLQLAAKTMDKLVIAPNETFSFFWLTRHADRYTRYKDGLNLVNGKIVGSYGGGLCQLSNMLFWLFLHTPMTIVERHGHAAESFPSTTEDLTAPSIVLLEQLRTLDKRRLERYIGRVDSCHIREINRALAVSVGLMEEMPENLIMCLCPTCANNFYGTGSYFLRRVNTDSSEKDICTYCGQRRGFDYEVVQRPKDNEKE